MRFRDIEIVERTIEELTKLGDNPSSIARIVGCPARLVSYWLDGLYTPSTYYLRRFHEIGCDVLYILTGTHYTVIGGDSDV